MEKFVSVSKIPSKSLRTVAIEGFSFARQSGRWPNREADQLWELTRGCGSDHPILMWVMAHMLGSGKNCICFLSGPLTPVSSVRKISSLTNPCRTPVQVSVYITSIFLIQVATHIHFTPFSFPSRLNKRFKTRNAR